jgi:hypothetical protein
MGVEGRTGPPHPAQRIWRAQKLQPHRLGTFKRSRDPSFAVTV